jgi:hypothetical protein
MTDVEYVKESQDVVPPIDRLIHALGTDPGLWHQASVSFNSADGMQVCMHHAKWAAVVEMAVLLGLGSEPDEYHRLEPGSSTIIVGFSYGDCANGGVSLTWFSGQDYAETIFGQNLLPLLGT